MGIFRLPMDQQTRLSARSDADLLPREPRQQRSKARVARILAAADALLCEGGVEAVTAHGVAERAGVPPSSVYQYFPTPGSILFALAQQYSDFVIPIFDEYVKNKDYKDWKEIIKSITYVAMEFYSKYPQSAQLVFGYSRTKEIYETDKSLNETLAKYIIEFIGKNFILPSIHEIELKFVILIELSDVLWEISIRKYGTVTEKMRHEAYIMMTSYLGNFLPDRLPIAPLN